MNDDDQPSINVNGTSHPILCGFCKKPVAFRGEVDPQRGEIGCAACGNYAGVQEVASIAIQYAKDEGQLILNRMARDTARQSKLMTFSGQTEHNTTYRFVVGDLQI